MKSFCGLVFVLFSAHSALCEDSLINAWTNPVSAHWEDPKWSLGVLPGAGQSVLLTNEGWKAVAIGPGTAQNFPDTLNVDSLILGGDTNSFNVLLLNFAGFAVPLTAGSIHVGTNSGITALASVLNVSTNSGPGDLSIFDVFNQAEQAIVNAHSINLGNVTNTAAGSGSYNETNGTINADTMSAWSGSSFNQMDGSNTIAGALSMGGINGDNFANYTISGGTLTAGNIELERGSFNQTGGSVTLNTGPDLGAATYTLSGGTLESGGMIIPSVSYGQQNPGGFLGANAILLQTGGTNFCNGTLTVYREYGAPGVPLPFLGPGFYVLSNGVLCVSNTVGVWLGSFQQWGGLHTNAGTSVTGDTFPEFQIEEGSFTLGGGTLITPWISMSLGDFMQSGGTNQVSGDVGVGRAESPATFTLSGGLLTDMNTIVAATNPATPGDPPALFSQSGGTHLITNYLLLAGDYHHYFGYSPWASCGYVLSNGVLNVPNIEIDSHAFFEHDGGSLTSTGLVNLGYATWYENTSGQQFGQLLLSAPAGSNATFSLPAGNNCIVHFADSRSMVWSNQATFVIANWTGSANGGGQHQVIFGSSASGLGTQQVSQVAFRNPDGISGTFPAQILSTGEIVPDRFLSASTSSTNHLTIEWSSGTLQSATNITGPYENVGGATSPYQVPFTDPARFFRLSE